MKEILESKLMIGFVLLIIVACYISCINNEDTKNVSADDTNNQTINLKN